jgi:hypothetical protein
LSQILELNFSKEAIINSVSSGAALPEPLGGCAKKIGGIEYKNKNIMFLEYKDKLIMIYNHKLYLIHNNIDIFKYLVMIEIIKNNPDFPFYIDNIKKENIDKHIPSKKYNFSLAEIESIKLANKLFGSDLSINKVKKFLNKNLNSDESRVSIKLYILLNNMYDKITKVNKNSKFNLMHQAAKLIAKNI